MNVPLLDALLDLFASLSTEYIIVVPKQHFDTLIIPMYVVRLERCIITTKPAIIFDFKLWKILSSASSFLQSPSWPYLTQQDLVLVWQSIGYSSPITE